METLMTVEEVAEITRLSAKTLYAFAQKRMILHVRLGGRLLFERTEIESWIDLNRELVPLHKRVMM